MNNWEEIAKKYEDRWVAANESNRQLREENKELQATIAARESLIADTMQEKASLETDSEKINECLKLALGDEWNRANPIIVPYLIKRERDQLREELERVKTFAKDEHDIVQLVWKALGKETYRESKPHTIWEWVELQRAALAAAKEALEYAQHRARREYALTSDEMPTIKTNYDNALARIAECEKETT